MGDHAGPCCINCFGYTEQIITMLLSSKFRDRKDQIKKYIWSFVQPAGAFYDLYRLNKTVCNCDRRKPAGAFSFAELNSFCCSAYQRMARLEPAQEKIITS